MIFLPLKVIGDRPPLGGLCSLLWVLSRVRLATIRLIELLQRLDRLVRRRDELLPLAGDSNSRRRLGHLGATVRLRRSVRHPGVVVGGERRRAVPLCVRGALRLDRLATLVAQWLLSRLLELGLAGHSARDRLRLHQA